MPSIKRYVTNGAFSLSGLASSFHTATISIKVGRQAGVNIRFGLQFQNIAIPKGATISSATLTALKKSTTGSPVITLFGNNVDNAPVWSTSNKMKNAAKTSASASLDVTNATSVTNVTSIVQEIVNRSGWASGNALAIEAQGHTAGAFTTNWIGYAIPVATTPPPASSIAPFIPVLDVTYTTGGSTVNSNFFMLF